MSVMKLIAILVLFYSNLETVLTQGIRCFECHNYPSPNLCTTTTTCAPGDYCHVEEIVTTSGHIIYNSGCRSKSRCSSSASLIGKRDLHSRSSDLLVCTECCQNDYCNNEGCNAKALPRVQRGPYCFTCDFMTSPDSCDKVNVCDKDEQCILSVPTEFAQYPTQLYRAECMRSAACKTLSGISTIGGCPAMCCNDDFCNIKCGTPHNVTSLSTTASITSSFTNPPATPYTATPTTPSATPSPTPPTTPGIKPSATPSATSPTAPSTTPTTPTSTTATTTPTTPSTTMAPTQSKPQCNAREFHELHLQNSGGTLCLKIGREEGGWEHAREVCRRDNADLVVLDTDEKIQRVRNYLENHHEPHHERIWIGLYELQHGDTVWIDGQSVSSTVTNWKHDDPHGHHPPPPAHEHDPHHNDPHHNDPHHPDHEHKENCVLMEEHDQFQWHAVKCDEHHAVFICEIK